MIRPGGDVGSTRGGGQGQGGGIRGGSVGPLSRDRGRGGSGAAWRATTRPLLGRCRPSRIGIWGCWRPIRSAGERAWRPRCWARSWTRRLRQA